MEQENNLLYTRLEKEGIIYWASAAHLSDAADDEKVYRYSLYDLLFSIGFL